MSLIRTVDIKIELDDVLPYVLSERKVKELYIKFGDDREEFINKSYRNYYGYSIPMYDKRYQNFKTNGVKCVNCGIEGEYFALEVSRFSSKYHLNLYAIDKRSGEEVLMTVDHIVPLSKGGLDMLKNMQTMCIDCNQLKADRTDFVLKSRCNCFSCMNNNFKINGDFKSYGIIQN